MRQKCREIVVTRRPPNRDESVRVADPCVRDVSAGAVTARLVISAIVRTNELNSATVLILATTPGIIARSACAPSEATAPSSLKALLIEPRIASLSAGVWPPLFAISFPSGSVW
jgi:hypothetical protein